MKINSLKLVVIIKIAITFILMLSFNPIYPQTSWTKLEYYYNVGSLPPPYHYNYTITITYDGSAELEYTAGYTKTENNTYKYKFEIDKDNFRTLKKEIKRSNVLNLKISQKPGTEIPDGGHSDNLQIFDNDKLLNSVPSYPESKYDKILARLYKAIVKCIPDSTWEQIESFKAKDKTY